MQPHFEVVESPGGLLIGARRNAEAGKYYWRITQWIMPCMTMIPPRGDHPTGGHYWVPIDDENCWVWNWDYHATRPLTQAEVTAMDNGSSRHVIYEVVNGGGPGARKPTRTTTISSTAPRRSPAAPTAASPASRCRIPACRS